MTGIFEKLAKAVEKKEIKQREIAEQLGINQTHVSGILSGKHKPSKTLTMLAEIVYGDKRPIHPDRTIAAVERLMEDMDENAKAQIFINVEEKKLARELMKEMRSRKAA